VKRGACASLTLAWICQKLTGEGHFTRGSGVKTAANRRTMRVTVEAVPSYVEYATNYEFLKSTENLIEGWGLELDMQHANHREESLPLLASHYASVLKEGEAVYIHGSIKGGGNHAVGIYSGSKKRQHFFDPNMGEYRIWAGFEDLFYAQYLGLIKRELYELAACRGFAIRLP
jgi:hypothetical protein